MGANKHQSTRYWGVGNFSRDFNAGYSSGTLATVLGGLSVAITVLRFGRGFAFPRLILAAAQVGAQGFRQPRLFFSRAQLAAILLYASRFFVVVAHRGINAAKRMTFSSANYGDAQEGGLSAVNLLLFWLASDAALWQ